MLVCPVLYLLTLVHADFDNFPVKSINVDKAWDVEFYTNPFTEQNDLEDPHPVHGIETSDGGFIFVGKGFNAGKMEGFALKISSKGEKDWLWTSKVAGDDAINAVLELPDGGVVLAGWRTDGGIGKRSLTKLALANGNEDWTTTNFGDSSAKNGAWEMIDLNQAKDAVLLAGLHNKATTDEMHFKSYGNAPGGSAIVMSTPINKLTNLLAPSDLTTIYDSTGTDGPSTAKAARGMVDGETAILTWGEEGNGASMIVVDSAGQTKWGPTKFEDKHGEGTDMVVTLDGHFAISGHGDGGVSGVYDGRLTLIDKDGGWKWSKSYSAGGDQQIIYNECWGLQALSSGFVLACGTGIENCEVAAIQGKLATDCKANKPLNADPRKGAFPRKAGVWQSLTIMTDSNGDLQWQRVDQLREAGDPKLGEIGWDERSSASEYVTVCSNGDLAFINDEGSGVGIMKLGKSAGTKKDDDDDDTTKTTGPAQCSEPDPSDSCNGCVCSESGWICTEKSCEKSKGADKSKGSKSSVQVGAFVAMLALSSILDV